MSSSPEANRLGELWHAKPHAPSLLARQTALSLGFPGHQKRRSWYLGLTVPPETRFLQIASLAMQRANRTKSWAATAATTRPR